MSIADLLLSMPKAGMFNVFVDDLLEGCKPPWHFVDERTVFVSRSVWNQLREELPDMPALGSEGSDG